MQRTILVASNDGTMKPEYVSGPFLDAATLYSVCGYRSNRSFSSITEWPLSGTNDVIQLWGKTTGIASNRNAEVSDFANATVYGRCVFVRVKKNHKGPSELFNVDEKLVRGIIGAETFEEDEENEEDEDTEEKEENDGVVDDDEDAQPNDDDEENEEDENEENVVNDEEDEIEKAICGVILSYEKELEEEEYYLYSDEEQ